MAHQMFGRRIRTGGRPRHSLNTMITRSVAAAEAAFSGALDRRFNTFATAVNSRFHLVNSQIDTLLDNLDAQFEAVNTRMDVLSGEVRLLGDRLVTVEQRLDGIENGFFELDMKLQAESNMTEGRHVEIQSHVKDISSRMSVLEGRAIAHKAVPDGAVGKIEHRGAGDSKASDLTAVNVTRQIETFEKRQMVAMNGKLTEISSKLTHIEKELEKKTVTRNEFLGVKTQSENNQLSIKNLGSEVAKLGRPTRH